VSLAEEGPGIRPRTRLAPERAREVATRVHADPVTAPRVPAYVGLVTRTIAFALDAAVINLVALGVGVAVGLAVSILDMPSGAEDALVALGGVAWFLWSAGYFVVCWSTTGQTPGDRLLRIRVGAADDLAPLSVGRAVVRLIGLTLAAIPLFAGFLPILVDDRRRGLHDMLAGSVVVGCHVEVVVRPLGDRAQAALVAHGDALVDQAARRADVPPPTGGDA
jgi:uncharacterized RDD family membrane protein YckC